jgi:hypothetical protein
MPALPAFMTSQRSANGFVELADLLIASRDG